MNIDVLLLFLVECDYYVCLLGMNDKELKKFVVCILLQFFMMYEEFSDVWVDVYGEKELLFMDEVQVYFYGYVVGVVCVFNIFLFYWKKYCKGQMIMRQVYFVIVCLFNDEWWIYQFKGQCMCWYEVLLIVVGEVNKDCFFYVSKYVICDVCVCCQVNLEFFKLCDFENREIGECIDFISKVMGSIFNFEICWMELMNIIVGIECYVVVEGDVGMFIMLIVLLKYYLICQVGKGESKIVQLNYGWNDEVFNLKDVQCYFCCIWSLMCMVFKDNDLQVYGLCVVELYYDGMLYWYMMFFCNLCQCNQIIEIMCCYVFKEDGDERGVV